MQQQGEANTDTCAFNDLALIKIDQADASKVNQSTVAVMAPASMSRRAVPPCQRYAPHLHSNKRHER